MYKDRNMSDLSESFSPNSLCRSIRAGGSYTLFFFDLIKHPMMTKYSRLTDIKPFFMAKISRRANSWTRYTVPSSSNVTVKYAARTPGPFPKSVSKKVAELLSTLPETLTREF